MSPLTIIVPDDVTQSFAFHLAREHQGVLQTDGRRNLIAPTLLRGFTRITGGGDRAATLADARVVAPPTAPDAA